MMANLWGLFITKQSQPLRLSPLTNILNLLTQQIHLLNTWAKPICWNTTQYSGTASSPCTATELYPWKRKMAISCFWAWRWCRSTCHWQRIHRNNRVLHQHILSISLKNSHLLLQQHHQQDRCVSHYRGQNKTERDNIHTMPCKWMSVKIRIEESKLQTLALFVKQNERCEGLSPWALGQWWKLSTDKNFSIKKIQRLVNNSYI